MKNLLVITVLALVLAFPAQAATDDFIANGNITVSSVAGTGVTADMLIISGSKAESWTITGGALTVTNPNTTGFMVGSADGSVKAIEVNNASGVRLACAENTLAGTSSVTLPTDSGTYTVIPTTTTDCKSYCSTVTHAASYNSFPTCGAASCDSGYSLTGTGGNAACSPNSGSPVFNGGSSSSSFTQKTTTTEKTTPTATTEIPTTTSEIPSTPTTLTPTTETAASLGDEAKLIVKAKVTLLLESIGAKRVLAKEKQAAASTNKLAEAKKLSKNAKQALINFAAYGTKSTSGLSVTERLDLLKTYKTDFVKLPSKEAEWKDLLLIATGQPPIAKNAKAERDSLKVFKKIYKRDAKLANSADKLTIMYIAYGIWPAKKDLAKEKEAVKKFKAVYGYVPKSQGALEIVRAIAYGGVIK